jgi:hypothetical protein
VVLGRPPSTTVPTTLLMVLRSSRCFFLLLSFMVVCYFPLEVLCTLSCLASVFGFFYVSFCVHYCVTFFS